MTRTRLNSVLYVVALLTAAVTIVVAIAVVRALGDDGGGGGGARVDGLGVREVEAADEEEQERYADVITAATEVSTAFVNIRWDDAQASIDRVKELSTGAFRRQYDESTGGVVDIVRQNRSVMTGEVLWAGVVAADDDSATAIVATSGTVTNQRTGEDGVARSFRLQLELVRSDGQWLTSDLQFVG